MPRFAAWILAALFALPAAPAAGAPAAGLQVPRHAEETRALTEPLDVLESLPDKLAQAQARDDLREVALLRLAESNACRVLSRTQCQKQAATTAREVASRIGAHDLVVRGLVLHASADIGKHDYSAAEATLAEAEAILRKEPHALLLADVLLSYSSIAFSVGHAGRSADYAARGIAALGAVPAATIRVRLMRNLARAQAESGKLDDAEATLQGALEILGSDRDPRLRAELHAEGAHIASLRGDAADERLHGDEALAIGKTLNNDQIQATALEILARVNASQAPSLATAQLREAAARFATADLPREERRVLRLLVPRLFAEKASDAETVTLRLIDREATLEARDQAGVAQSFEARLAHAEGQFQLELMQQSMTASSERQRLTYGVMALAAALCAVLAVAMVAQRRTGRRLGAALQQARENELRYATLTDHLPAAIAEIDRTERYLQVNAHLAQTVGRSADEIVGKTVREIRGEEMYVQWKPHLDSAMAGQLARASVRTRLAGQPVFLNSIFVPKLTYDGQVDGVYALTFDVTELKIAQEELEGLARIDALTGTANRRHFEERLTSLLAHARRMGRGVAVLAIDVDHFKRVNDTHGHAAGDTVLREIAARIQRCVRKDDFLARLGGDEFVLLIEEPPTLAGEVIARKLLACSSAPMQVGDLTIEVTLSIGVAMGSGEDAPERLLQVADEALYEAKRTGRATFVVRSV